MKVFILLVVLGVAFAEKINYYRTADNHYDMQSVVDNPKKLQDFVDCFLDRKPCDPVPASYRKIIPETIETACYRCNADVKHLANVFMLGLKKNNPTEYVNFVNRYDPEGKYIEKFMESVKGLKNCYNKKLMMHCVYLNL
ncbi:unnamed protein product [Leptosia nina]|uniref:Chemosensory protein n=1 Tax=Leptosia nina TaxID=320188 RepID=A0AAV1JSA6_9NEOP